MKTETMQIKILIPSENHYLFNEKEKIISDSDKVYLGKEANESDWQEITADEKESLEEKWKNEINAEVM